MLFWRREKLTYDQFINIFLIDSRLQAKYKNARDAYRSYKTGYEKYIAEQDYISFREYFTRNEMQKFKAFFESEKWKNFLVDYFKSENDSIPQPPRATLHDCGCSKMYYAYLLDQEWIPMYDREEVEGPLNFDSLINRKEFMSYAKVHVKDCTYTLQDLKYLERLHKELQKQN